MQRVSYQYGQTYKSQPVLVPVGVVGAIAQCVTVDVLEDLEHRRYGYVWFGERQAIVFQRQPGYDPSYEWVFYEWADII